MATSTPKPTRCAAPSRSPRAASAPPAPTRSSAASILDAAGDGRRRGLPPAAPAAPHAEVARAARGRRAGPRRHRRRHPRTLQPHRPHRPLRPGADRGRGRPRRLRRSPTPTRGRRRRRDPARRRRRRRGRPARRRGRGAVNAAWLTSVRRGRPYVTWKYAATLDGRIAAADGTSRWITSPESRADVHRLRAERDAVVVGSGTAAADDPHLAVRGVDGRASSRCAWSSTPRPPSPPAPGCWTTPRPPWSPSPRTPTPTHLPGADGAVRLPRAAAGRPRRRRAARRAARPRRALRAARGRPDARRRVRRRRAPSTPSSATSPPPCSAPGPPPSADAGISTIAAGVAARRDRLDRLGPDLRITAVPAAPP